MTYPAELLTQRDFQALRNAYRACNNGTDDYAAYLFGKRPSFGLAFRIDREADEQGDDSAIDWRAFDRRQAADDAYCHEHDC